jgi:hypothetical protein
VSHWNYRVIRYDNDEYNVDPYFSIHEVYYHENGELSWSVNSIKPQGESPEELRADLELMLKALDKPVMSVRGGRLEEE